MIDEIRIDRNTIFIFLDRKPVNLPFIRNNLLFPFLDRRQAIFIDFVIFGTDVAGRRMAILNYLTEKGHYVEEVKNGSETLLKVDNYYYRVFPMTKVYYKVPVQGANLVPVYK